MAARTDTKAWHFVDQFISTSGLELGSLNRSMVYWLEWNSMIVPNVTFRLESLSPASLVKALGMQHAVNLTLFPQAIPSDVNHESHDKTINGEVLVPDVSWRDLYHTDTSIARSVFALAKKLGYERGKQKIEDVM